MGINGDMIKGFEFKKFATPRIIGGIAIVVIVLWALVALFGSPDAPSSDTASHSSEEPATVTHSAQTAEHPTGTAATGHTTTAAAGSATHSTVTDSGSQAHPAAPASTAQSHAVGTTDTPGDTATGKTATTAEATPTPTSHGETDQSTPPTGHATASGTPTATHTLPVTAMTAPVHKPVPKGVAFVEASIKPLEYELEDRWWGWRPNDIINVTDNVNNFQMGVLEVTRRTIVALADRITRYGTTDAYDPNLEDSMNWIMVKAGSYWFPSAESKYREALDELRTYNEKLKAGKATFYTRADNLIPLLATFEDLLGSCDTNLVKEMEEDGNPVSFFSADDYFFYSKGVANSMATVLEAVLKDFRITLESRHATELMEHAIVACHHASTIDPFIILDRNLSSILANHRANMAAPVSHARFYLGQLIKTLST